MISFTGGLPPAPPPPSPGIAGPIFECDDSITNLDPLVFLAKRMLHILVGRLESRHLAARTLELQLQMEAGGMIARRIT
jgi:hypothetical protein